MDSIALALNAVRQRMALACDKAGRSPHGVQLLAVSKFQPWTAVWAAAQAGQRAFGENYVQEGVAKIQALRQHHPDVAAALRWHLIGPLQSNKTREVAEHFDAVDSIDRLKVAQRLSDQRPAHLPPLQLCVQVNVSGEASKSGVAPSELLPLLQQLAPLPRVQVCGLMAIPEPGAHGGDPGHPHRLLQGLFQQARRAFPQLPLHTLSTGMSDDLEAAIAEGSTCVRVGTAIFGRRPNAAPA